MAELVEGDLFLSAFLLLTTRTHSMSKLSIQLERTAYATIVLAAVIQLASPFLIRQLGYDGFHARMWIEAFPNVMRAGIWYPHWLPDAFGGLGSSTFYFYPPLAFFIIAPLRLLLTGVSPTAIYHIFGLIMTLASILSMRYFLSVLNARRILAWFGSLLYGFSPYHFDVLYVRSGPAEHLAFVWAPLVFAGIFLLLREDRPARGFLLFAISWGLLLLSHVPAAVTIGIGGLAIVISSFRSLTWPRFGLIALATLLGTALAAFYFLPVAHFSPYAQLKYLHVTQDGLEDPFHALFDVLAGNNLTVKGIAVIHYVVLLTMTVVLFFLWKKRGTNHSLVRTFAVVGLVDLFFQNAGISRPVWDAFSLTQIVQFSWRWNLLASLLVGAVYATMEVGRVDGPAFHARNWINGSVVVLALAASIAGVFHNFDVRVNPHSRQRTPFDPPEYAPIWANSSKDSVVKFALAHQFDSFAEDTLGHAIPIRMLEQQPNEIRFQSSLTAPTTAVLHHWYWPSWTLHDSSTGDTISQQPFADGRASFVLPAGEHEIEYHLETTTEERAGVFISLAALLAIIITGSLLDRVYSIHGSSNHTEPARTPVSTTLA